MRQRAEYRSETETSREAPTTTLDREAEDFVNRHVDPDLLPPRDAKPGIVGRSVEAFTGAEEPVAIAQGVFFVATGAWPLLKESLEVLLESTPPGIKTAHVVEAIEKIHGVKNVHDLHIWAVEPRLVMLTCHVMVEGDDSNLTDELLATIRLRVASEFGIKHLTIQMETQCGHGEAVHCDLSQLTAAHPSP